MAQGRDGPPEHSEPIADVPLDEAAPLLAGAGPAPASPHVDEATADDLDTRLQLRVIVLIYALLITVQTFAFMQDSAQVQVFEDILCAQRRRGQPVAGSSTDDSFCKSDIVQADLAWFGGWMSFLDGLPGECPATSVCGRLD